VVQERLAFISIVEYLLRVWRIQIVGDTPELSSAYSICLIPYPHIWAFGSRAFTIFLSFVLYGCCAFFGHIGCSVALGRGADCSSLGRKST